MASIALESLFALECSKENTGANNRERTRESMWGDFDGQRGERGFEAYTTIKALRLRSIIDILITSIAIEVLRAR